MSAEYKIDYWSTHSHKVGSILTTILPSFLHSNEKIYMLTICKNWNKILQNKLFWKGKFTLSNTQMKQIALNDRQRICDQSDVDKLGGFTQKGIDEINEYLNLIHDWIIKMGTSLQLITELVVDLIIPNIMPYHMLENIWCRLTSCATIQTLEMVSTHQYLMLIKKCAPTLENLILNIRDESYAYHNLHELKQHERNFQFGKKTVKVESDRQIHDKMLNNLINFFTRHMNIELPKLTDYRINIGLTSLKNKKDQYMSSKSCTHIISNKFEPNNFPTLKSFNLNTETGSNYSNSDYDYDWNSDRRNVLEILQTKCSKLEKLIVKCCGIEAHFIGEKMTTFKFLADVDEEFEFVRCITNQIGQGKWNLDNIDIDCGAFDLFGSAGSFLTINKKIFDHTEKIIVRCNCQTPLVRHKHMKKYIDNYKNENSTKKITIISEKKETLEIMKTMKLLCGELEEYINIGQLLETDDYKHDTKLHVDIECNYCQSGDGCNFAGDFSNNYDDYDNHNNQRCYKCYHGTDCIDNIIQFMILQPSVTSFGIHFDDQLLDSEDEILTPRVRKIMEASQLHNIDVSYYSLLDSMRKSNKLFLNYEPKLDKCCINNTCKHPITTKEFPFGLQSLDFLKTNRIEFICDCETRSKEHHRQQISNIKEFIDDNITIQIETFNIKCYHLDNYLTKGDLKYFHTKDGHPINTINILCDCYDSPKCRHKIITFIKENESNDINISYVVKHGQPIENKLHVIKMMNKVVQSEINFSRCVVKKVVHKSVD